jgi:hypothetical protein
MFRRKKKVVVFTLYDADGVKIYDGALSAWPIPEIDVIRLSVHYFNDPEPCPLHRSAVCQRAYLEILEAHLGAEREPMERLGAEKADWFPGAARFSLREEEK